MARVSDTPWSKWTQADYTPAQWREAALIDTGVGDVNSKGRYKVPVREPDGTLNRNGIHAAAGGHGIGAVEGISEQERSKAARKLVALYRMMNEDPPPSIMKMAGMMRSEDAEESVTSPVNQVHHYRSFTPDLEVKPGGDGRTIYGIAVPYNKPARIDDTLVEQFARGAFNHQLREPHRVKFAREHVLLGGDLIGAASMLRDDAAGLYGEWRVSRTSKGDETLELVRDGALDELSVMFRERQNRHLTNGVTERVKADAEEVAVVMIGAYGRGATVAGVRSTTNLSEIEARSAEPVDLDMLDAQTRAAAYLNGLPSLPDYQLKMRLARLGMPID